MITTADIEQAQQAWGDGIVAIATAHRDGGDYAERARVHVEALYAYGLSEVLFKPTLAAVEQFRPTFDEAWSYFTASNGMLIHGSTAQAMGNYFFTDPDGNEVKVEYTFGYVQDEAGALRINLHHSSMPAELD